MNIYLDNCCFNRPFDDQRQLRVRLETEAKLSVQEAIRKGDINLVWSYIMDLENFDNPYEERRESIARWRKLSTIDISESPSVLNRGNALKNLGLKNKDALHLSCAIEGNSRFFLTTDDGILKKANLITDLAVISPIQYASQQDDD